jgi:hypothetical protein
MGSFDEDRLVSRHLRRGGLAGAVASRAAMHKCFLYNALERRVELAIGVRCMAALLHGSDQSCDVNVHRAATPNLLVVEGQSGAS